MKITLYIDFDTQEIYKSKEEARKAFENNIGFLDDYDPLPIEEWLEDNYTVVEVWNGDRELFIKDYNKHIEEKFNEWFNDCLQEATVEV